MRGKEIKHLTQEVKVVELSKVDLLRLKGLTVSLEDLLKIARAKKGITTNVFIDNTNEYGIISGRIDERGIKALESRYARLSRGCEHDASVYENLDTGYGITYKLEGFHHGRGIDSDFWSRGLVIQELPYYVNKRKGIRFNVKELQKLEVRIYLTQEVCDSNEEHEVVKQDTPSDVLFTHDDHRVCVGYLRSLKREKIQIVKSERHYYTAPQRPILWEQYVIEGYEGQNMTSEEFLAWDMNSLPNDLTKEFGIIDWCPGCKYCKDLRGISYEVKYGYEDIQNMTLGKGVIVIKEFDHHDEHTKIPRIDLCDCKFVYIAGGCYYKKTYEKGYMGRLSC